VLPGVAYLEMARAALEQALPQPGEATVLELRNVVWLKPVVVAEPKQISIALFANDDDQVAYEIYSTEAEQETIHCQGEAAFRRQSPPVRRDIEQLKKQMNQGKLESSNIYAILAKMGLNYGPGHRGIVAIHLGESQLLAQLHLPTVVEASQHEYVLHPSVMDSALQASIGLIVDLNHIPDKPRVPFVLESARIISACTKKMAAWVRYSESSKPVDKTIKLDIDLCDENGNLCIQMRGLALRVLDSKISHQRSINDLIHDESDLIADSPSFDSVFYQKLIADIANHEVSVDEAVKLG
jgi:polyketide synthase-like dehydratase family protein/polyketide synthase family protein